MLNTGAHVSDTAPAVRFPLAGRAVLGTATAEGRSWLRDTYGLSDTELGIIALALEAEFGGERPTVGDALTRIPGATRSDFRVQGPLLAERLLVLVQDPGAIRPPLVAHRLALDDQIVDVLLGESGLDRRLSGCCTLTAASPRSWDAVPLAEARRVALLDTVRAAWPYRPLVLHFHGPADSGRGTTARALAAELGAPLLTLYDLPTPDTMARALREATLQGALLYVTAPGPPLTGLPAHPGIVILSGAVPWTAPPGAPTLGVHEVSFTRPGYEVRHRVWTARLSEAGLDPAHARELAARFTFGPGQIAAAVAAVAASDPGVVVRDGLFAAARAQTGHGLGALARRTEPTRTWDDLVLPDDALAQLEELCDHVIHQRKVWQEWGFAERIGYGRGTTALFSGPPGTGKTLAAEVVAARLGLDLYTVELSRMLSKYVGETEKNLERIFTEAAGTDAVLLFDEADALFGKRSEVRDAHDRYANIQISYLLQRMERYEGVALLATNLRQHLDPAFTRRLTFLIDFPLPGEEERRGLWERALPPRTPREEGLDLSEFARAYQLSGGGIRNIALRAAFLAAAAGRPVGAGDLRAAAAREHQKMGLVLPGGTG
ncbi:hypothetical protein Acor_55460 [Acrocarpospora corrugata]|uniref:AAA+ ATPase domain-containing protein n=1 Tax=Acrocarpospora corrugata TaxID=35763 RepID=A0A5M3W5F5_9ACTN|nr:hypothetical protein Acor_55460 [Acrocarpospora corrugata]